MMKNLLYLLPFVLFFVACQQDSKYAMSTAESIEHSKDYLANQTADMAMPPHAKKVSAPMHPGVAAPERKIIKHGDVKFQVADLEKSTMEIEDLALQFGGYVSNMNQNNTNHAIRNALEVKVPSSEFQKFVSQIIEASIYTDYKRIKTDDVSAEFYDISARLKTKKEVRDRYAGILRDKANTVEEVLYAEEKIRVIQEEIESIEGRLKYIQAHTAMSSISVEIYQEVTYQASPDLFHKSFATKVNEGFSTGLSYIQSFVVGMITIWPITLCLLVLLTFRKKIRWALKGYQVMK